MFSLVSFTRPYKTLQFNLHRFQTTIQSRIDELLQDVSTTICEATNLEDEKGCKELYGVVQQYVRKCRLDIKQCKPFSGLKACMLAHKLMLQNVQPVAQQEVKQSLFILQKASWILEQIKQQFSTNDRRTALKKQFQHVKQVLVSPYLSYLCKKYQFIMAQIQELQQLTDNGTNLNKQADVTTNSETNTNKSISISIAQNNEGQINYTAELSNHYQICYKYLNLLRKGLIISPKLISLLRYYRQNHCYLTDFNVLLAEDFKPLYQIFSTHFNRIKSIQEQLGIKSIQFVELIKEVQQIHEGMYQIFLNAINYRFTTKYKPIFIKLQTAKLPYQNNKQDNIQSVRDRRVYTQTDQLQDIFSQSERSITEMNPEYQNQGLQILKDLHKNFIKNFTFQDKTSLKKKESKNKSISFFQLSKSKKF